MRTRVGYAGGTHRDPTYHDLGDHTEAFALDFDPRVVSYDELLAVFWASHRYTRPAGSRQYMAAIFPSPEQYERARASRPANAATFVEPNARFYLAEDYHQKYYLRHDRVLMAEFEGYSEQAFVDSTVAARLNALAAGHAIELDALDLAPKTLAYARSRLAGRRA